MPHVELDHSDDPIRLFKSDFLEFFTHITPLAILIIWVPVIVFFLFRGFQQAALSSAYWFIPVSFLLGLFVWSLAEYLLHRFLFHFKPKSPTQEKIAFLFHGVHHAQPKIKTRLVMPPVVAIPLAAIFYGIFYLLFETIFGIGHWIGPSFAAFITGYLIYDLTHYATHHFPMRKGIWKALKRHHMAHHYKNPDLQYGVSSPLWDYFFKTMPKPK